MNVGIVGSRSFPQLDLVRWFVSELPRGISIISGGAIGVDNAAVSAARDAGLSVIEKLPLLAGLKERHQFTEAYYARNQEIVNESDLLVAFTEKDRGGTWDTIKRAVRKGIPVKIMRPQAIFKTDEPGPELNGEAEGEKEPLPHMLSRAKGAGPFHLKRVSLGSFALKLRKYLDPVDWADFINQKDSSPEKCAARMVPDFVAFFQNNNLFGKVHALTQAPKSIRHLDRKHPMDFVCRDLSAAIGVPFVEMFKPWNKSRRGRFAAHPDLEILPSVKDYLGCVVFVLDDVSTTNFTLKSCVRALISLEIHSHGVAWIQYA